MWDHTTGMGIVQSLSSVKQDLKLCYEMTEMRMAMVDHAQRSMVFFPETYNKIISEGLTTSMKYQIAMPNKG